MCIMSVHNTQSYCRCIPFFFFLLLTRKTKVPVFKYLFLSSAVLIFTVELQTEADTLKTILTFNSEALLYLRGIKNRHRAKKKRHPQLGTILSSLNPSFPFTVFFKEQFLFDVQVTVLRVKFLRITPTIFTNI